MDVPTTSGSAVDRGELPNACSTIGAENHYPVLLSQNLATPSLKINNGKLPVNVALG